MRIIHTADLHLGSSLGNALPADKIPARRRELVNTFVKLADFAEAGGFELVLLSGDVFDQDLPPRTEKEFFYDTIKRHPNVNFLYLKGNHDSLPSYTETIPNLFTFGKEWTCHRFGNVCVHGIELPEKNKRAAAESFRCDPDDINIVMLHGQTGGAADDIVIRDYSGKGIDYMALGHIHSFSSGEIDVRGKYAYSGCLEGRGFDETGEKGFAVIDTDKAIMPEFVPFACRTVRLVEADITGQPDKQEALAFAEKLVGGIPKNDILRLVFKGEVSFDTAGLAAIAETRLKPMFFHVSVKDKTSVKPDVDRISREETLAGEFVRLLQTSEIPEGCDRGRILTIGLKAISGQLPDYKKER